MKVFVVAIFLLLVCVIIGLGLTPKKFIDIIWERYGDEKEGKKCRQKKKPRLSKKRRK